MDHRQEIYKAISEMLDNPDECGIYPTTKCYDRLEAYCNSLGPTQTQTIPLKLDQCLHGISAFKSCDQCDSRATNPGDRFFKVPAPTD